MCYGEGVHGDVSLPGCINLVCEVKNQPLVLALVWNSFFLP